jgi:hypothetical protein
MVSYMVYSIINHTSWLSEHGASVRSSQSSHSFLSQNDNSGSDGGGTWTSSMLSSSTISDRPSDEEIERLFAKTAVRVRTGEISCV